MDQEVTRGETPEETPEVKEAGQTMVNEAIQPLNLDMVLIVGLTVVIGVPGMIVILTMGAAAEAHPVEGMAGT